VRGGDALVEGSERLARTVIGNLIGNALHHGDGRVRLEVDGARLVVSNTAVPRTAAEPGEGFGFGLGIAADLCARFGWRLQTSEHSGVFTVVLDCSGRPDRSAV
jgi:signal transduction histidine kinase